MKNKTNTFMFSIYLTVALLTGGPLQLNASAANLTLDSFSASPSPINTGDTSTWTLGIGLNAPNAGEQFSSANLTFTSGDGQTAVFNGPLSGSSASIAESFAYGSAGTYLGSVAGTVVGAWDTTYYTYKTVYDYGYVIHMDPNPLCGLFCHSYTSWEVVGQHSEVTGSNVIHYTETFSIDGSQAGLLSTSWQQNDPVYGTIYTWGNVPNGGGCDWGGCWTNYSWEITGSYIGVTGYQLNTHSQTLAFDGLTVDGVNVAAVPEPETYAMMLAGLGLLGFMARRRKQKEAAAT
jgi:hypothetical protein